MATEKRLIDANALIATLEEIATEDESLYFHLDEITQEIFDAPTEDAVEVVRCKDCKGCTTVKGEITRDIRWFCEVWRGHPQVNPMGYCSYGERKDND